MDDPTQWGAVESEPAADPTKWGAIAAPAEEGSAVSEFFKSIPTGIANTALEAARGEQIESEQRAMAFGEPNAGPKIPTGEEAIQEFGLHKPEGIGGTAGRITGELAVNPATYLGEGSLFYKAASTIGAIVGATTGEEVTKGTPLAPVGGLIGGAIGNLSVDFARIAAKPAQKVADQFDKEVGAPAAAVMATEKAVANGGDVNAAISDTFKELQAAHAQGIMGDLAPESINIHDLARREEQSPAEFANSEVPAQSLSSAATPAAERGQIAPGESQESFEARHKEWVSKIDAPDDVKEVIDKTVREGNFFPEARTGEVTPAHVNAVAEAAGVDPKDIDGPTFSARFDSDAKVNAVIQALRRTTQDVIEANKKMRDEPSPENAQAAVEAEERNRLVTEYAMGQRADSSRSLSAWKGLLREQEHGNAVKEITNGETEGQLPKGLADVVDAAHEVRTNIEGGKNGKVGLQKLVDAAERLANAPAPAGKEGKPPAPLTPEVRGLVDTAKAVLAKLRTRGAAAAEEGADEKTGLQKLVDAAERQVGSARQTTGPRKPTEALDPDLQALVDKADLVTKRFGGVAKGEEAAFILAKAGRTPAEQAEIARSIEGLTPTQVARVLDKLRKPQGTPWYYAIPQQLFLTGPITHALYAGVNLANIAYRRMVQPFVASLFDKVLPGKSEMSSLAAFRALPELLNAVPDAGRRALQALKTGERVLSVNEDRLIARGEKTPGERGAATTPYTKNKINFGIWQRVASEAAQAKAEKIITAPGAAANAIHTFFRMLGERAAAGQIAYTKAAKEVGSPARNADKFWARYEYHLANPEDKDLSIAAERGYAGTYMEEMGPAMEKLSQFVKETPLKWVVFFMHIPFNIVKQGAELMPTGLLAPFTGTRMGKALRGELGREEQSLALASVAVGSAISGYFIHKGMTGEATGDYPTDPKEQRRWKDLNIQPYSIKMGDRWVSMERFGSLGMPMKAAADYGYIFNHHDFTDPDEAFKGGMALALSTGKTMLTDSGFDGVMNIVQAIENREERGNSLAWQLSGYAQPASFLSQIASTKDPFLRETGNFISAFKNRILLERETLLPKRDPLYGAPLPNPQYHSILRNTPVNTDPAKAELDRLHYYPMAPEKTIAKVKLSDEQYDRYEATAGPLVQRALAATIQDKSYQGLPDAQKTALLKGIISDARKRAAQTVLMHDPTLYKATQDLWRSARGLEP